MGAFIMYTYIYTLDNPQIGQPMSTNQKNMRHGRHYCSDLWIKDVIPGFYSPGFNQYGTDAMVRLRKYLWEKHNIGLISEIEVYQDKLHYLPCFHLSGIRPTIWKRIIRPGIEQYVDLLTITTYSDGYDIRVKEKTP